MADYLQGLLAAEAARGPGVPEVLSNVLGGIDKFRKAKAARELLANAGNMNVTDLVRDPRYAESVGEPQALGEYAQLLLAQNASRETNQLERLKLLLPYVSGLVKSGYGVYGSGIEGAATLDPETERIRSRVDSELFPPPTSGTSYGNAVSAQRPQVVPRVAPVVPALAPKPKNSTALRRFTEKINKKFGPPPAQGDAAGAGGM